jgi:uncharacterized repeat protein (TIGR03803 family)
MFMQNVACCRQSLETATVVASQIPATTMKARMLLALIFLISLSTLASASEPVITQLFSFPCPPQQFTTCHDGAFPNRLIQASDGNFYGAAQVTVVGSSNPQGGTLFKITPAGQFRLLFTFTADAEGNYPNGTNPASSLVEANDGFLYGAASGGANNDGVLFRIAKNGLGFKVVHSFCAEANCSDGMFPGNLLLGQDGNIYGTTLSGGSGSSCCGTIFRLSPATGVLTTLFDFNGTTQGGDPGALVQGTDGNFYGTAGFVVFRFSLNGTFKALTRIPEVDGFLPTSADSPLVQASNGKLYGALSTYDVVQVQFFEINPAGTGFHEFPQIGTLTENFSIDGLIQASDGNLWTAFTETGEPDGVVVAMSPTTGAVVHSFFFDGTNGGLPEDGVIQGADGKIYGTAILGGVVSGDQQASGTVWVLDAGLAPPAATVAAFSPATGAAGTKVTIRGNHFIGTTAVTFNGVRAAFTALNTNFIIVTVPVGATTGKIGVTNAGGETVTAASFTVP